MNQTLIQGLKRATEKGESLQQAMMSFFNAGYSKQQIEGAAQELRKIKTSNTGAVLEKTVKKTVANIQKSIKPPIKSLQKISNYGMNNKKPQPIIKKKLPNQVSKYGGGIKKKSETPLWIIIIMSVLLLGLLGVLSTVLFFKEEITAFFGA